MAQKVAVPAAALYETIPHARMEQQQESNNGRNYNARSIDRAIRAAKDATDDVKDGRFVSIEARHAATLAAFRGTSGYDCIGEMLRHQNFW